ncbi:hypothetical protein P0M11_12975 [Kaistella sp. PBT33-4]|uniref:hypothetical protein n=1 Tax=Kaistella sp. PBT33-4 TaxID=3032000 RepID=UPI0023D7DB6C|nr:hypothetical protein [Kaistella sp. PBT33-4]MDF0720912.1 hypothetical protein [Kaistella sp. PBT33-4]
MDKSIFDEFQEFKNELKKLNIEVLNIVKVGNGSMDFHEIQYRSPRYDEVKKVFMHRHRLEELLQQFKEAYNK